MASSDPWPLIQAERTALVADLAPLPEERWATPSLCEGWSGETVLHGEDIRRPLGITRASPAAAVTCCLDFYKGSNLLLGTRRRIAGLTLRATDLEWSTGTGPEVTGPAVSLLLAMTGRPTALADLSGPGLPTLTSRTGG